MKNITIFCFHNYTRKSIIPISMRSMIERERQIKAPKTCTKQIVYFNNNNKKKERFRKENITQTPNTEYPGCGTSTIVWRTDSRTRSTKKKKTRGNQQQQQQQQTAKMIQRSKLTNQINNCRQFIKCNKEFSLRSVNNSNNNDSVMWVTL